MAKRKDPAELLLSQIFAIRRRSGSLGPIPSDLDDIERRILGLLEGGEVPTKKAERILKELDKDRASLAAQEEKVRTAAKATARRQATSASRLTRIRGESKALTSAGRVGQLREAIKLQRSGVPLTEALKTVGKTRGGGLLGGVGLGTLGGGLFLLNLLKGIRGGNQRESERLQSVVDNPQAVREVIREQLREQRLLEKVEQDKLMKLSRLTQADPGLVNLLKALSAGSAFPRIGSREARVGGPDLNSPAATQGVLGLL